MGDPSRQHGEPRSRWLPWMPLAVGAINSYGSPTLNYGFALYFLTYQHGFVKRGLVGEFFSPLRMMTRGTLTAIEYLFLAAAFALTYVVFRNVIFGSEAESRFAGALLVAPAALPHIGYLFAQPDVTLYILVLLCLALLLRATPGMAALVTCPLCCLGLLAHEAFCLMFYPLIAAVLLHLCVRRRLRWIAAVAHVLVVSAVFAAILHWGKLKVSSDAMLAEAQSRTNVGVQRQLYDVMASTLAQQWALVHRMYSADVVRVLGLTLVLSAPYFVLLTRLLNGAMRSAGCRPLQIASTWVLFLSPLLLCALGHDTTRWIGAICLDATLFVLYLYLEDTRDGSVRRYLLAWAQGPSYVPWLIYLIAVGPYGATGLRTANELYQAWNGS